MRWYNKDKTKMINLDDINGYVYISSLDKENTIEIILGGTPYAFTGIEADEIYNNLLEMEKARELLKNIGQAKQLLNG